MGMRVSIRYVRVGSDLREVDLIYKWFVKSKISANLASTRINTC